MSLNMHPKPIAARAGSSTLVNSLALAGLLAATLALSACGKNEEAEAKAAPAAAAAQEQDPMEVRVTAEMAPNFAVKPVAQAQVPSSRSQTPASEHSAKATWASSVLVGRANQDRPRGHSRSEQSAPAWPWKHAHCRLGRHSPLPLQSAPGSPARGCFGQRQEEPGDTGKRRAAPRSGGKAHGSAGERFGAPGERPDAPGRSQEARKPGSKEVRKRGSEAAR